MHFERTMTARMAAMMLPAITSVLQLDPLRLRLEQPGLNRRDRVGRLDR
jgi:hypothetical protein